MLIVPPFYDKVPKAEGVIAYFDRVFGQVSTPIRYYHIPRITGVPVDVSVFKALTQYPNFVGVKNSNGDPAEFEAITAALPGLNVATGTDNNLEAALGHGNGCILASGNFYTRQVAAAFEAHRARQDVRPALQRLADAQAAVHTATGGIAGEAVSKYTLALMLGRRDAFVRPPSAPLAEEHKPKIEAAVAALKAYA